MIKELVATVLLWVFFGYIISDNATKCLPKQFEARQKNFELISSRIHIFSATPWSIPISYKVNRRDEEEELRRRLTDGAFRAYDNIEESALTPGASLLRPVLLD